VERAIRLGRLVVGTPLVAYACILAGAFVLQRSILYPVVPSEPFLDLSQVDRVQLSVAGGTLPFDRFGAAGAPRVLFFHGNAEQIGFLAADAADAGAAGLAFAAVEYPGYGDAHAGTPSEAVIFEAGRAALDALAAAGEPPPTCVGHSLGSGVAVAMAAEGRCARLVAISPYTSIGALGAHAFPWLPARWLVLDRYDSLGRAPAIRVPALVIHGRRDDLIPVAMGEELAAALGARFVGRDRGHADVRDRETWAEIGRFVLDER
jgi:pimeloyl-ACP methyl ester carboxylesterase